MSYQYIMSCGHIANAVSQIGEPFCSKCFCFEIEKEIEGETLLRCSHWGCPEITPYGYCSHITCVNPKYNGENQYRYPNRPIIKETKYDCPDCKNDKDCNECKRTEFIHKEVSPFAR